MDWTIITTAVIGLLAPFAAKVGEGAAKKLGEDIYNKLKGRFIKDKDESAQKVLDNYVAEPDVYDSALGKKLAQKAEANPDDFGVFLKSLAEKAGGIGGSGGQTAIGSYIQQVDRGSTGIMKIGKTDN